MRRSIARFERICAILKAAPCKALRPGSCYFGLPPKTKGGLAFIRHLVAVLNAEGWLGVVMPHGLLFRGGSGAQAPGTGAGAHGGRGDDESLFGGVGLWAACWYAFQIELDPRLNRC